MNLFYLIQNVNKWRLTRRFFYCILVIKRVIMFKRILIPLDGSVLAEGVIPHAEQFARIFGSTIVLLEVLDPVSYHGYHYSVDPLSWQIRKAEADVYLNGIAEKIRKDLVEGDAIKSASKKEIRVEYAVREGKAAENIINFAQSEKIDLLIISTHGMGGLSRWNISSITQKVINLIYTPVLIIRAYNPVEPQSGRVHYRGILIPIDTSRRAECSLPIGIALAKGENQTNTEPEAKGTMTEKAPPANSKTKTKLFLTAVIKPPELPVPEPYPVDIEKLSKQLLDSSRKTVNNYLEDTKKHLPVDCETRVVESSNISSAIQDLAGKEEEIDLVLLCAHGYSGESSWPYGSVARNYMEHGTKPVLVIQDIKRSQLQPTAAELAAEKSGRR
jgi:nucleotide-binding universal stress UspA family protein